MKSVSNLILSIISFLFIISISVIITLNFRPLYYFDMEYLDIPAQANMEPSTVRENYDALIDYNSFFNQEELQFPTLPQSESGRTHFAEVKRIFVGFQYAAVILFLLLVPITVFQAWKHDLTFLKYTGILTLIVPAVLAAAIALNWQWVFVLFHEIVFRNDFWLFDPATDPVITILPDTFFMHCAGMILGGVVLMGVLCLVIYKRTKKQHGRR